jgi:hypothetical protein
MSEFYHLVGKLVANDEQILLGVHGCANPLKHRLNSAI